MRNVMPENLIHTDITSHISNILFLFLSQKESFEKYRFLSKFSEAAL